MVEERVTDDKFNTKRGGLCKKMMKRTVVAILVLSVFMTCFVGLPLSARASAITVTIDGKAIVADVPPTIINGRTLLPLRAVYEALGATVGWDDSTLTVTGTVPGTTVIMQIGNSLATVNGTHIQLDVPPRIINGRTMVPLRFVAQSLGAAVEWVERTQSVLITTKDPVGKTGGSMKIAMDAQPAHLDMMMTTATLTWTLAWHMYEGLFTLGSMQEVIPMLATDYTISDNGLVYNINLRQGVPFHNGKEMTSVDVIASLNRWGALATSGKTAFNNIETLQGNGKYQVVITLKKPDSTFIAALAAPSNGAIITTKEMAEKYPATNMTEYVGTGPYEFVEWRSQQHIKLKRFVSYKALDGRANGYGGRKVAYVDELVYIPVTDATVQAVGVETGQFHYAYSVNADDYDLLKKNPNVQAVVSNPRAWLAFIINTKEGIMSNVLIRQAFQAALDLEEISMVSRGPQDLWRLDPSLNQKETVWWSPEGIELYNQNNIEKSKTLLKQAGYNGEPIRWMASYDGYYNAALTAKSQLEKAGFVVDLQKFEVSTEVARRRDPALWDLAVTGYTMRPDPTLNTFIQGAGTPGWWDNAEVQGLLEEMRRETDFDKRFATWEKIQRIFYEEVPYLKICDYATLRLLHKSVVNFQLFPDIFFWNVWLN